MGRSRSKRVSEVVLDYKIEDNDADKRAKQLLENIEAQADAISMVIKEAERFRRETLQASKAERTMDAAVDDTTRQLRENADALHAGARGAEEYGDSYRRASEQVESFGDVATNVSQVAGALRGFGAGGVADIALVGADITDAVEGVRRLGPAFTDVSRKALDLVNTLPRVNLSMGQFLGATVGIGVAIAAVAVAFTNAAQAAKEVQQAAEEATAAQLAGRRRAAEEAEQFTTEELQQRQAEIARTAARENELRQEAYNEAIALAQDFRDRTSPIFQITRQDILTGVDSLEEARAVFDNLASTIVGEGGIGTAGDEINQAIGQFNALAADIEASRNVTRELDAEIRGLEGDIVGAQIATNDAAQAEADLEEARQQAVETAIAAARAEDEAGAREKFARAERLLDLERDRAALEDELIDLEIRNNQAKAAARKASAGRIDQLETQFDNFLANANTQIADANAKAAEQRAKIEKDYMAKERKAFEEFTRDATRAEEDYNRERVRRLQDLGNDLLAAEEANDVIAFIRAQRQGQQDIQRLDEDASTESKRKAEDFAAEQKERKKEAAQRLVDLRKQTTDRIKEIRAGIDQQRQLLQEQIAAERDALVQRINDLNQGLSIEIQERRKAFQQSLIDQQNYNNARAALEAQLAAKLLSISRNSYADVAAQVNSVYANKQAYAGAGTTAIPPTTTTGFSGVGALAGFAAGLSTGNTGYLGNISSGVTNIILNGDIGSDLSRNEVKGALAGWAGGVINTISGAYSKAG